MTTISKLHTKTRSLGFHPRTSHISEQVEKSVSCSWPSMDHTWTHKPHWSVVEILQQFTLDTMYLFYILLTVLGRTIEC